MSSRFPPSNPSEGRYQRERSSSRPLDRRSTSTYNDSPLSSRLSEPGFRSGDSFNARRDPPREPPRGPRALLGGARGGYNGRGRGYINPGDGYDRDPREARDEPPFARRGRGQDWSARDRFDTRERRPSSPSRDRSRSPLGRDCRDVKDGDSSLRGRDSRDGPLSAGSSVSDTFAPRGRGGFRGRGRDDWEYNRGRAPQADERGASGRRSPSREREWTQPRDDREREAEVGMSRRDDDARKEREENREQPPYRPDSRNSGGLLRTPLTSRSTSTTSIKQTNADRFNQNLREPRDIVSDPTRKQLDPTMSTQAPGNFKDGNRAESERYGSRTTSPPPQAPPVPAFGSIPQRTSAVTQETQPKQNIPKLEGPPIHPSRLSLLDSTRDVPTAPKADISRAPTAPKSQQKSFNDLSEAMSGMSGSDGDRYGHSRGPAVASANQGMKDASYDSGRHWTKRFSQPGGDPDTPLGRSISSTADASRASSASQTSARRAVEDQGRVSDVPPISSVSGPRPPADDAANQKSPIKIPTGPRAERSAPPIRHPAQPSIRGPINRRPQIMQRPGGRQSNWSWIRPGLPQSTPRAPSIMQTVPTKRDHVGEEKSRPSSSNAESAESTIEAWRRTYAPSASNATGTSKSPESGISNIARTGEGTIDARKPSLNDLRSGIMTAESGGYEDSDDAEADDAEMDLDEKDYNEAEEKFNRELRALEARMPPSPQSDPALLEKLEMLDALVSALEEKVRDGSSVEQPHVDTTPLGLPSPKLGSADKVDIKSEEHSPVLPIKTRLQTPPIESLPFLCTGLPTPFSEMEELQIDTSPQKPTRDLIIESLTKVQESLEFEVDEARSTYARLYKPWRMAVEDEDDLRKTVDQRVESPEPAAAPTPAGRRGKIISELDWAAVLRESQETAAREEQARRERQAPVYVPENTFNPEREAVVPVMLSRHEARSCRFDDLNNIIQPDRVLAALKFVPEKDDFTPAEQEEFLLQYIGNPKKFGDVARHLPGRTYQDCVKHYYLTKLEAKYKVRELQLGRKGKGKGYSKTRGAQIKPKFNLVGAALDGTTDYNGQAVALTEKGRPRRAAAPTFGESAEPECAASAVTPVRRTNASKDPASGNLSSEKPTGRRTRTVPAKEKVGRRGKAPLLAAAPGPSPGPSPQKENNENIRPISRDPAAELMEQRVNDLEGAQVLAGLPTINQGPIAQQSQVDYTESWLISQPPAASAPLMQDPPLQSRLEPPQSAPQPKTSTAPGTSSYWSVPEQQDFRNYVLYFGTDWQTIASTMKTKTHTMIKNYYTREINKGEDGKALELAVQATNERRKRGENMGPVPPACPVPPKRRYDSTLREPQRPLAPLVDVSEVGSDSPSLRATKSQISPHSFGNAQSRFSASAQAEQGAAALSSQMLLQGPASPASRITIQPQQRSQQTPGPRMGMFPDGRSRPSSQPQNQMEPAAREQHQKQQRRQQQQQQQHQDQQHAYLHHQQQQRQEQRQQQIVQRQQDQDLEERAPQHYRSQAQHQVAINPSQTSVLDYRLAQQPTIDIDEPSRRALEQRLQDRIQSNQEELQRHRITQQRQQPGDGISDSHRVSSGTFAIPRQQTASTKPQAPSSMPMPVSPPAGLQRPNSVPATAASAPPAPPQPPKKSSIMNLLNDEPAEPKPSKRLGDPRTTARTPEPQATSSSSQLYPQSTQMMQPQFYRRDAASDAVHRLPLGQSQQQQQSQVRESMRDQAPGHQRALFDAKANFQLQSADPGHAVLSYMATTSRPGFQLLQRDRVPSPTPFSHSRTSSYTSIHQQQAQSQPRTHEHRTSIPGTPAESTLRPSPYANLNPHQPQLQHHNPTPLQQQHQLHQQQLQEEEQRERMLRLGQQPLIYAEPESDRYRRNYNPEPARPSHQQSAALIESLHRLQQDALMQQEQQSLLRQEHDRMLHERENSISAPPRPRLDGPAPSGPRYAPFYDSQGGGYAQHGGARDGNSGGAQSRGYEDRR